MVENNLWVDTDADPRTVWRYDGMDWDTEVTEGDIKGPAVNIAGAEERITNLLDGTTESDGLYELMVDADT